MGDMKVEVYHARGEFVATSFLYGIGTSKEDIKKGFHTGRYENVLTFFTTDDYSPAEVLDHTWWQTQNMNVPWRPSNPCRSSAMGDIFVVGKIIYIAAMMGFDEMWGD